MLSSCDPTEANQQKLWDEMHGRENHEGGLVGRSTVTEPNELAIILAQRLEYGARILEIGTANGRDARYWAAKVGAQVCALDFSQKALDQSAELNKLAGLEKHISTKLFDANTDDLPVAHNTQNAFYARSSLHVSSRRLIQLLEETHRVLQQDGIVAIEGKHMDDPKIKRSAQVDSGDPFLVSDPYESGHIRRVWEPNYTQTVLQASGFEVLDLDVFHNRTAHASASIFTRVIAVKS